MAPSCFALLLPLFLLAACRTTDDKVEDTSAEGDADTDTDTDADTDADTDTDTTPDGAALYSTNCSNCHAADGTGTYQAPDITREIDLLSDADIVDIILDGKEDMPAVNVSETEAQAIVDWMRANL